MPRSPLLGKTLFAFLLMLLCAGTSFAQSSTDQQLAAQYYRDGEFEKAVLYYERLYEHNQSDENYHYFLGCLLALENFKDAQRLAERQSKDHPKVYRYQVDVGEVLLSSGDKDKADKHFGRLLKDLDKASVNQILDVGKAFIAIDEPDWALEVYYSGRKQMGDSYPFHFQIAQILGQKGDVVGMINEYLDVLQVSNGYIQSVQNTLNRVIGFEEDNRYNAVLLEQLQKRIQRDPSSDIYAEMLVWTYMQQNKYSAAMIQVKALDKRNKEDGERVLDLANLAMSNYKYNVAIDGYEYVKSKGPGYYYIDAITGLLQALKAKVTTTEYDQVAIEKLVAEYKTTLDELGRRSNTAAIILDYAYVKAFYESKYSNEAVAEAIEILQAALQMPGLNDNMAAVIKTKLADIYVLSNRIWDASLLYGQVEKKFKYDEIGHEAKLKNAKVFYYAGDFGWAEAQLKVLKGSTSKLISNDALELSAFIAENTGLDSTGEALSMFARTELLMAQHKYDSALLQLTAIEETFPTHDIADNILFQRARIFSELRQYQQAADAYMQVADEFSFDILSDNALIEAGRLYEGPLNQESKAMEVYKRILDDHPGSLFVVEARKRFRTLRGDEIQ